ncbi:hypothetical protein SAMN05421544_11338 [Riemerella columbipharyngis]|uniref:Uncharacterized protein n=1 Tax=Riemerella columbipharyngis TaxID=1071918 RepID=A0A1G7DZM1_9FLAO|nr:hypothetical protein SAMN05421544_11338 [Riemerella columbipharyngis]
MYVITATTQDRKSSITRLFRVKENRLEDNSKTCKYTSKECDPIICSAKFFGGNCKKELKATMTPSF